MKILVIGDSASIYVEGFIKNVLLGRHEVVIATAKKGSDSYKAFYYENGIVVETFEDMPISKCDGIRSTVGAFAFGRYLRRKHGKFDFIHVHGLNRFRGNLALSTKSWGTNIVITVWGSELLRSKERRLLSYKRYYRIAKKISFENSDILSKFKEVYPSIDEKKYYLTGFGDEMFQVIDKVQGYTNKEVFLSKIGVNKTKTIIAIGYNRNPAHRHLDVIKELIKLPDKLQTEIMILLLFTYGPIDNQYLEAIDRELKYFKGTTIKFCEYLKKEELAEIICNVDVFIHAQLTDVQSMTLMEYLYTGTIVLNGSWLKYRVLSDNQIFYYTYDEFIDLPEIVSNILNNEYAFKMAAMANHEKLKSLFDWETLKSQWLQLYKGGQN